MNLPHGWIKCKFSDIATIRNGYAFSKNDFSREQNHDNGIPLIKQTQLDGNKVDLSKACYLPTNYLKKYSDFLIQKNDVLIGMSGSIGKLCIYQHDFPALQNQRTGLIKTYNNEINNKFFWLFLQTIETKLMTGSKGVGVQNISSNDIGEIDFSLPPLPEQQRIVAKIDALFSELDSGVTLLKTIKTQLAVYRQAVLKWAFEGKLTDEWRKINHVEEWKYVNIEKFLVKSDKSMSTGPFGTMLKKHEHQTSGVPVLGIENIGNGIFINGNKIFVTSDKAKYLKSFSLHTNDVIISRSGTVGELCLVPQEMDGSLMSTNLIRVTLDENVIIPKFFIFLFQSKGIVIDQVKELCKGSTRAFLNQTILKKISFPFLSIDEQRQIIDAIESRLSVCDKLEQTIDQTLALSASLRQSILKKAFEGRLVPQDPNDEPAEKLLERIKRMSADKRAEKSSVLVRQKQTRKRGGK